ncbi:MAG: molybdopterin-dependent oxidoreductase [Deltaproteobacteria bacterium]|nr:molybdopterin-dependent oxidoreductase [Candidatus Anaeroferrophillus wilburensis]MBN2888055.1 molybdopterin-dependent oxidoreductase [Deltaproteobacteria bacterium]
MAEELRWLKTHCARMDHGGCSLLVGVRNGRIEQVKGDPEGYLNRGYICPKGLASADRLSHPHRLTHPLKRVGERGAGKWERISWEEALQYTAEQFNRIKEQYGPKGVAFGVGMPKGLEHFVLIRLANLFGSPNVIASQDVCHAPREITGIHTCGFYPVADFHHPSKLVMLWGSNITSTNEEGEICKLLLDQLKGDTELVVIDPRRIDLAGQAKQWLRIRPGTDHALALAMLQVIIEESLYDRQFVDNWTHGFEDLAQHVQQYTPEKMAEITWIPAADIRATARLYATTKPAVIQWGNPLEHTVNTFDVMRALICLMAITGNLDVAGGNVAAHDPPIMSLGEFVRADLIPEKRKEMVSAYHRVIPRLMTIPPTFFKKAILDEVPYPIKGFYAMCSNGMLSYADSRQTYEALMKLDFIAIADLFMTPTASMADVVLPVASHYEINDIGHYGIGHGFILARPKIIEPPPECWSDIKIMNELGKLISPPELWHADHEEFLEDVVRPAGLTYGQFVERGYLKGPERFKRYEQKGFRTPTGKVELRLSIAEKFKLKPLPEFNGLPEEVDADYPLLLTSSKSRYFLHSSYRWIEKLRKLRPQPKVEIHPETAALHGVGEGDQVVIETRKGSIVQYVHLVDSIDPRVINAAHGWWFPEGDAQNQFDWKRANLNMLTSTERIGKEYGTPNLKGISCRIRRQL